jgi:hypothetical protein
LLRKKGYLDVKDGLKVYEVSTMLERIAEEELIPPIPPPPVEGQL